MSWCEFVLRCQGFKEHRLFTMTLTREVSYEIYRNGFIFSESNPVAKDIYWGLNKNGQAKSKVTPKQRAAYMEAWAHYEKEKNGSI